MTLIEVLFYYRRLVSEEGRERANLILRGMCEPQLWEDIEATVSDEGRFVTATGEPFAAVI